MNTDIRERPILFNAEMVRAILDGRKTQTRRPVKNLEFGSGMTSKDILAYQNGHLETASHWLDGEPVVVQYTECNSPFGQPGDLLWVRESALVTQAGKRKLWLEYEADRETAICWRPNRIKFVRPGRKLPNGCFKEASRIKLRVKRVWVERIQDISEDDAEAEGVFWDLPPGMSPPFTAVDAFSMLWESIYRNWDANPWVWCCEFERI